MRAIIQLIEPDQAHRASLARHLGEHYDICEASDGLEALAWLERTDWPIDLLITGMLAPPAFGLPRAARSGEEGTSVTNLV